MDNKKYIIAAAQSERIFLSDQEVINSEFTVEQDGQLELFVLLYNLPTVTCNLTINLIGDRSRAEIKGLYALDGTQRVTINAHQHHEGKDSYSNLVFKGMVKGKAYASYEGLINIVQGASGTDAAQTNKNIILSKDAKVVSIPSLEVLQHDVQCCHGSAIGKFDKDQLWYLESKGLQPDKAHELLVRSFFQDVLDGCDRQDAIMDILCQKMI